MQRPSFLGEEKSLKKTSLTKEVTFLKNCCFLLIFSDQDNIAKLVVGEEIFLTDFVNYCSIQFNKHGFQKHSLTKVLQTIIIETFSIVKKRLISLA